MENYNNNQKIEAIHHSIYEKNSAKAHHWFGRLVFIKADKMRRRILFLFGLFLVLGLYSSPGHGQVAEEQEWTYFKEDGGIKVYYSIYSCSSQSYLHLKLHNSNSIDKSLMWMAAIRENDGAVYATPTMSLQTLKAGEERLGECNNLSQTLTIPFKGEFDVSKLTVNLMLQ